MTKPNPQPSPPKSGWTLIFLSCVGILILSFFALRIFSDLKKIEQSEISLETKRSKTNIGTKTLNAFDLITSDDPHAGSSEAKVKIVEFSDFECPYCRKSYPIIKQILEDYGDQIYFVYRDYPLDIHAQAAKAAEAGECAQDQGAFWEMHNKIFENQDKITTNDLKKYAEDLKLDTQRFNNCLDSSQYAEEVKNDYNDGTKAGVKGTPTFFINNQIVPGSVSLEKMKQIIGDELTKN